MAEDLINHPPHYQGKGLECIEVIEAFGLGYNLGNVVKYLLRAGKKEDSQEDLKKAAWYLNREIGKGAQSNPPDYSPVKMNWLKKELWRLRLQVDLQLLDTP